MTIDLDALEALAKAATPGPWEDDMLYNVRESNDSKCVVVVTKTCTERFPTPNDAAYIAAANPAVVLELVAELRKTRAERDWLAEMVIAVHETGYCPPEGECPIVNANPDHGDCVKCWLKAARDAVKKEAKE